MKLSNLTAISPVDGRYGSKTEGLRSIFSEYALIKNRVHVEVCWLKKLATHSEIKEIPILNTKDRLALEAVSLEFDQKDALRVKEIEKTTNHDVKAIEYFIKERISENTELSKISEFVHFACTSEDINNLSHALMLKEGRDNFLLPTAEKIIIKISDLARKYADISMLSHTHGQAASPTTVGKEFANVSYRLNRQVEQIKNIPLLGKINGAVGNYNAHLLAYPDIDWEYNAREFVTSLGLSWNSYTTQIEPHDYICEISNNIAHANSILIGFSQDMWSYISKNYFIQKNIAGEIGSSTMPHKINPINFENAEGNLGLANSILRFLSEKLTISRLQRDLSDSTVLRNIGISFGYSYLAYGNLMMGLHKLSINSKKINDDIVDAWEILAEPIQMVARKYHISNSYELLKKATRGKKVNKEVIHKLIMSLKIPENEKKLLLSLTPKKYIGYAIKLCNEKY